MKSIEFVGSPGSGKSYYEKKIRSLLLKKGINNFDNNSIFYLEYISKYRLNFINKILVFFIKRIYAKENNILKKIYNFLKRILSFQNEYEVLNNNKIIKKFNKQYFSLLKKNKNSKYIIMKLKKWLSYELPAIFLSKKIEFSKNSLIINSEGICQRIIRLFLKNKIFDKKVLSSIDYSFFESDILIFVDVKPKTCFERVKKRSSNQFTYQDIKNFYMKSKIIYNISKKKKFRIKSNKDILKIIKKIPSTMKK